jgi:hypothetical protein
MVSKKGQFLLGIFILIASTFPHLVWVDFDAERKERLQANDGRRLGSGPRVRSAAWEAERCLLNIASDERVEHNFSNLLRAAASGSKLGSPLQRRLA